VFTACLQAVSPLELLGIAPFDGISDNAQLHKKTSPT